MDRAESDKEQSVFEPSSVSMQSPSQNAALCWHYTLRTHQTVVSNMKLKNQDKENTDEFMLLLLGKMIMTVIPRKKHHKVLCVHTGILRKINCKN